VLGARIVQAHSKNSRLTGGGDALLSGEGRRTAIRIMLT